MRLSSGSLKMSAEDATTSNQSCSLHILLQGRADHAATNFLSFLRGCSMTASGPGNTRLV
jgi:hypothetical protein